MQLKEDGAEDTALGHTDSQVDSGGCGGAHPGVLRPVCEEVVGEF